MKIANTIALAFAVIAFSACGTNPVTGKRELQFISEADEIQLGEKSYAPSRQAEGGDLEAMPELTAYVSEIGHKLAAVADRQLPYEFKVLDNSVPNAWAMPGGKIAVNRGLLTELNNESELAAVLGHEIVHAAARHGAKAQERGTLMQAGMAVAQVGAAVGGVDSDVAGLVFAGGGVGLQMVQMNYGREQELEADHYGMTYMKRAGYDPVGAVTLQETFVRITSEQGGKSGFFDRMFASHPPSAERVEKNKAMARTLGVGGEIGEQTYRTRIAALIKAKPAYDKYDQAIAALKKKDYASAASLAAEASRLLPQEGRFHELRGEIEVTQKRYQTAIPHYERAIQYNPSYFGSYLGGGIAQFEAGNKAKGQEWMQRSHELLPTQSAAYYLGRLARDRGDMTTALQHFKSAASSESGYGQLAAREYVSIGLQQRPEQFVAAGLQVDDAGRITIVIQNRAPVALKEIQVTPLLLDPYGGTPKTGTLLKVPGTLAPDQQYVIAGGLEGLTSEQRQALRLRVDTAKVAE